MMAGVASQTAYGTPGQGIGHHRRSLPEMQPGFMFRSRVQPGRCSLGAVPTSGQVQADYGNSNENQILIRQPD